MAIIDNQMLWRQFGAAIDMLGDVLRDGPDELWEKHLWDDQPNQWVAAGFSAFWYLCYRMCRFPWGELPFAELQLYNLRHVQEHGAQLAGQVQLRETIKL